MEFLTLGNIVTGVILIGILVLVIKAFGWKWALKAIWELMEEFELILGRNSGPMKLVSVIQAYAKKVDGKPSLVKFILRKFITEKNVKSIIEKFVPAINAKFCNVHMENTKSKIAIIDKIKDMAIAREYGGDHNITGNQTIEEISDQVKGEVYARGWYIKIIFMEKKNLEQK